MQPQDSTSSPQSNAPNSTPLPSAFNRPTNPKTNPSHSDSPNTATIPHASSNPNIVQVHNLPQTQAVSSTLTVISAVVLVFGIIAGISYFSFNSALQSSQQERKENELLYNDPNQVDILGLDDSLPEVQVGIAGKQKQQQAPLQTSQQQQQNEYIKMPDGKMQKVPPKPTNAIPTRPPRPTKVPDGTYLSSDNGFSVKGENWKTNGTKTDGDAIIETLDSSDGKYKLRIGVTSKKFDSLDEYLDTNPRGRKPLNGTESITLDGETGKKTNTFEATIEGTTYKSIGAYVFSKDKDKVYSIELDSTELDINNKDNVTVFEDITKSFSFLEIEND